MCISEGRCLCVFTWRVCQNLCGSICFSLPMCGYMLQNICEDICLNISISRYTPQHLCGGQERAFLDLFSPSTMRELRIKFRLSYLHTLSHLSGPPLIDFYLEGHAVMVGNSCLRTLQTKQLTILSAWGLSLPLITSVCSSCWASVPHCTFFPMTANRNLKSSLRFLPSLEDYSLPPSFLPPSQSESVYPYLWAEASSMRYIHCREEQKTPPSPFSLYSPPF